MKRILFIFILLFFLIGCSRILDLLWNPNQAEFNIYSQSNVTGQIRVTFNESYHSDVRCYDCNSNDSYFWGYYIYRNSSGPYDDFTLIGIDSREKLTVIKDTYDYYHWGYVEVHGSSVTDPDPNGPGVFIDTCTSGVTYYYRVVVVYRSWDKKNNEWESDIESKAASSWTASLCK
ncbi:MAG TPA: hypothetical protein PKW55_05020 [Spirochaetota bacterium]|nr:hypothetical protein [Spirochaetota bacterium]HPQ49645.1 hypothetical protein [Spirochaetota bacterium]